MLTNIIKIIFFCVFMFSTSSAQVNPVLELKIHDDVIDTIAVKDGSIYTGSYDGYVKKTDLKTHATRKLLQQDDWIRSILIVENELIVAGNEGSIVGIDLQSEKQTWKIDAHSGWITGLVYVDGKLISISMDEHVKVWDIVTKKKLYSKKPHGSHKHLSVCEKNKNVSVGSTSIISSLSLNEDYNIKELNFIGDAITALSCSKIYSDDIFGLSNGKIIRRGKLNIEKRVHIGAVKALLIKGNKIYSASDDGKIIQSNSDSLDEAMLVYSSNVKVSALREEGDFLYAGFADGTIKVFDLKGSF